MPGTAPTRTGSGMVTGMLQAQIARVERIDGDAVQIWLVAPGTGRAPAPYLPGQYVTLALASTAGTLYRSYSLSSDGRSDRPWEITVKRHRDGAVSSFLCERATPGMLLYATPPRGSFTLPAQPTPGAPLVFVAAGSGITPIYGILRALAQLPADRRPAVQLHYATPSQNETIYGRELATLDPRNHWLRQWYYLSAQGGRLTPELALAQVGAAARSAQWYICGPSSLKRGFQAALAQAGVPAEAIHVEVFGDASQRLARPAPGAASNLPVTARLRIAGPGSVLDARSGETVLDALERNGYAVATDCRSGNCGTCRLRVLAGQTRGPNDALTPAERAGGYILSCIAEPVGDVTLAPHGISFSPRAGGESPRVRRTLAKKRLRWTAVAAALALFLTTWRATQQTSAAGVSSSNNGDDGGAFSNGDDGGSYVPGNNGSSGVTTQPGNTIPSTGSGVSRP